MENRFYYYLSPELLNQIDNPYSVGYSLEKSDVFSLGMIALEMALLEQLG
jgi:serine/threonine protein kinase